jgi:hypothetical protein
LERLEAAWSNISHTRGKRPSFASATDAASNATSEVNITTYGVSSLRVYAIGNRDFLALTTDGMANNSGLFWCGGLVQEFVSSVSATPNQVILVNGLGLAVTGGAKMVESPTGTFNVGVNVFAPGTPAVPADLLGTADPNLDDGLIYLWPLLVGHDTTDRL